MNDFVIKLGQAAARSYLEKIAWTEAATIRRTLNAAKSATPERVDQFASRMYAAGGMAQARNKAKGLSAFHGSAGKYVEAGSAARAAHRAKAHKLPEGMLPERSTAPHWDK